MARARRDFRAAADPQNVAVLASLAEAGTYELFNASTVEQARVRHVAAKPALADRSRAVQTQGACRFVHAPDAAPRWIWTGAMRGCPMIARLLVDA